MKQIFTKRLVFLVIISLLLTTNHLLLAQSKTLYGSYMINNTVYKYQCNVGRSGYSLDLMTLEGDYKFPEIDTMKFRKTVSQIELGIDSTGIPDSTKKLLVSYDTLLKRVGTVSWLRFSDKDNKELISTLNQLLNDSLKKSIDTIIAKGSNPERLYDVTVLLKSYKEFLARVDGPQKSKTNVFPEMKLEEFQPIFQNAMYELSPDLKSKSLDKMLLKTAQDVFYEITNRLKFTETEPITAYVILKRKQIEVGPRTDEKTKKRLTVLCDVDRVQLEFEDGAIKNIIADLIPLDPKYTNVYGRQSIRFRNNMPISISGKFDPDEFDGHLIYLGSSKELGTAMGGEGYRGFQNTYFRLSELVDYKFVLESNKEDYSPANQVVEISLTNATQEVRKEKASKLFDARIYTDVIGFNDKEPNGLVQVEISRKVNLVTHRAQRAYICPIPFPTDGLKRWRFPSFDPRHYTGFLTGFEVRTSYNKIEKNNRYYKADSSLVDTARSFANFDTRLNLNPLDVMRYRKWTIGADVNLYKLNLLNLRTCIQVNGYFTYGQTQVADSLSINRADTTIQKINFQNVSDVNWTSYGIGLAAEFKPDSRYNFIFQYDWRWMDVFYPHHEINPQFSHRFHAAGISGFRKLSETSEIFFRFKRYWQDGNPQRNYDQIQLGYQLDLFSGGKSDEPNNK